MGIPSAGTRACARECPARQRRDDGLRQPAGRGHALNKGRAGDADRGGRPGRTRGNWAGVVVLAVLLLGISRTDGHKKYPETEYVTRELGQFPTQQELDEQVTLLPFTPLVPAREVLYRDQLAANGFGRQYPNSNAPPGNRGNYRATPAEVSSIFNWFKVVSGGLHTCALRRYFNRSKHQPPGYLDFDHLSPDDAPGQLRCWGMNDYGQVYPVPLPFGDAPVEARDDDFGNPGPACTERSADPRIIAKTEVNAGVPGIELSVVQRDCWDWDDGWRNLSAGWLHNCGILANGTMICWGNNDHGEMGSGAEPKVLLDGEPRCASQDAKSHTCKATFAGKWALTEFGGVSAGKRHTCAIKCVDDKAADYTDPYATARQKWPEFPPATCVQGKLVCWGDNRLAQGAGGLRALEKGSVSEFDDFVSVCAAAAHSCAVRKTGTIHCWGHNGNNRATVPQQLINMKWRGVKCRGASTCALTVANAINRSSLYCWGHNGHQQSIVPSFAKQKLVPVEGSQVPVIRTEIYPRSVEVFDTGDMHTCALWQTTFDEQTCKREATRAPAMNGECWGENSYGQSNFQMDTAGRMFGWKEESICAAVFYVQLSAGSYHSCGISIDDVGDYCSKDSQCDEYPFPLCMPRCHVADSAGRSNNPLRMTQECYDSNDNAARAQCAVKGMFVCPRHIEGNLKVTPRVTHRESRKGAALDASADLCVPTRTNMLRYHLPVMFHPSRSLACACVHVFTCTHSHARASRTFIFVPVFTLRNLLTSGQLR